MDNTNKLFLDSAFLHKYPGSGFGITFSDSDGRRPDKRIAQLLVLLKQLDESAAGLGTLPKRELSEILFSAIRVCGFVDPVEAEDVIATVFDAIESRDPGVESG